MKTNYRFFLGGHDLEMQAIRELLEAQGYQQDQDFFDRNLSWGASLGDYEDLFTEDHTHVCIELTEKGAPLPKHYLRIDHHDELSDRSASIEQLANLLGIDLTREQQLIAANDKGYIPAMEAMGASPEEIAKIRKADRRAQGVTEADEEQAIQDLQHLKQYQDLVVVKTKLSTFSPIVDRLYEEKQKLIYSPEELTYYGPMREVLVDHFAEEVEDKQAYYGGAARNGFFGIGSGHFSPAEIQQYVQTIRQLTCT
ncbi:MAG: hypothetical protein AAF399_30540 [Bacteroidota bacterium]